LLIGAQRPHFLPDFRYFNKIYLSDLFLFATHLRFRKQSPIVRANLKKGYITIPVQHHKYHPQPYIGEIQLMVDNKWKEQQLKTIQSLYKKEPFFDFYFDTLVEIYSYSHVYLIEFLNDIFYWHIEMTFPEKTIADTSSLLVKNIESLSNWLMQYEDPVFLVYPDEYGYYELNFPEVERRIIPSVEKIKFPSEYRADLPLLFLFFKVGPEAIFYFRKNY
jgi:hypothetical protein